MFCRAYIRITLLKNEALRRVVFLADENSGVPFPAALTPEVLCPKHPEFWGPGTICDCEKENNLTNMVFYFVSCIYSKLAIKHFQTSKSQRGLCTDAGRHEILNHGC